MVGEGQLGWQGPKVQSGEWVPLLRHYSSPQAEGDRREAVEGR